jgi:hypothetical protein
VKEEEEEKEEKGMEKREGRAGPLRNRLDP